MTSDSSTAQENLPSVIDNATCGGKEAMPLYRAVARRWSTSLAPTWVSVPTIPPWRSRSLIATVLLKIRSVTSAEEYQKSRPNIPRVLFRLVPFMLI